MAVGEIDEPKESARDRIIQNYTTAANQEPPGPNIHLTFHIFLLCAAQTACLTLNLRESILLLLAITSHVPFC
jgi:hypothetical protein